MEAKLSRGDSVSVTDLHVPLPLTIGVLVVLLGGVTAFSLVWYKTSAHAEESSVHVDAAEAMRGGGVAYKNDVVQARSDMQQMVLGEGKKTRRMIKGMHFVCHKTREGDIACGKVELLEDIE